MRKSCLAAFRGKLILLFIFLSFNQLHAQVTVATDIPTGVVYVSDTDPGVIIFGVKNTNTSPITITDLASYIEPAGAGTYTLWYHPTDVTGAPSAVTTANGWIQLTPSGTVTPATNGVIPILSGLSLTIPANTTYRLALEGPIHGPYYGVSGSTGDLFSGGGLLIYAQANPNSPTYAGIFPTLSSTFTPRSFYGSLSFVPVSACTDPPTAGNAVSSLAQACSGQNFTLDLTGNSIGTGQTYQWQSSPDNTNWTNTGSLSTSPIYTTSASSTLYYRAAVTCGASTVYSTSVQVTNTGAPVSGTYTINSALPTGSGNFQTFGEAVSFLGCGVSGPVVFNVAAGSGPYNEQVTIPQIMGTSSTNTVTFNGNLATVSFNSSTSTSRAGILLDGADHIIIDSLIIDGSAGTYAWGVVLTNQADSNVISNCTININNLTSSSTNYIGIVVNGSVSSTASSGNNGNGNLFDNNTITGGYYGVYLYGNSSENNAGNTVRNNTIREMYAYGVYTIYQSDLVVSGNDISRPTRSSVGTTYCIYLSTGDENALIEKNRIHNIFDGATTSTSALYAIYVSGDGTVGRENKLINNLIYSTGGNGTIYALYNTTGEFMQAYHNTVALDDATATSGAAYGIYQTGAADGLDYRNNIITVSRSGTGTKRCIYFVTTTSTITCNNNVLYMNAASGTNNHLGQFGSTNYTTLADWQTANGGIYDGSSQSSDPSFMSPGTGNYAPSNVGINNSGANVGVATDILDNVRNLATPDPGAYEFSVAPCTDPPTAGTAISSVSDICAGSVFSLDLTGNSIGDGQTYLWQSSPDNTNWTDLSTASATTGYTTSQTGSTYYRCAVKCGAGAAVFSTSVLVTSPSLISGTFTINNGLPTGSGNFQTFAEAVNSLACGIGGPVVFNVAPGSGPYNEQVVIQPIYGASATNTVTFNGNLSTLLYSSTTSTSRAGILLDGADHIIIDSLIIDGSAGSYAWGVILTNQADSNVISNCTINIGNLTSSSSNYIGIVMNGSVSSTATSGNNGNGNLFDHNTIIGGYYGVYLYGSSSANNTNNTVSNNTVMDIYNYGIYEIYQSDAVISGNDISRPNRSSVTTTYCIYLSTGCENTLIEKNRIHNMFDAVSTSTSTCYGIYVSGDGTAGRENKLVNNLIYNTGGNGSIYGLYNTTGEFMQAYHNTVSLDDVSATSGAAYGIYQTGSSDGLDYHNNIVSITRGGTGTKRCIYFVTTSSTITCDNNVLYMNAGAGSNNNVGQFGTTDYPTLIDWQTANGGIYDLLSVSTDPLFTNPAGGDYLPTAVSINNIGAAVGITTDILGNTRNPVSPDPGAYEFSIGACVNPPSPGAATSSLSDVCAGTSFSLDLVGNSVGDGQTYQWQSSPDNLNWTDLGPATTSINFVTSQTANSYYRCAVKCGAGATVYSSSVFVTSPPLVSGTYTINSGLPSGSGNFQSFAEAVSYIMCGIDGPVVFNVAPGSGPYNEQVVIPQIGGTSVTNTITFHGNLATVLYSSTNSSTRAGILLDGADHIIIDSLIVDGSGGSYAWGVVLTNQADSNVISNCNINIGNLTSTSTSYIGMVINGSASSTATSGNNGNGNLFDHNTVTGGYYGIYIYGSSSANNTGNMASNNILMDNYTYGIYTIYQSDAVISGNEISRPSRSSVGTTYCIYLSTGCENTLVEKNRIHNMFDGVSTSTSTCYGIYVSADATAGRENKIINNLIYNTGGNGSVYGIYNTTGEYMQAYHNTISLDDASATSGNAYGIYQTGSTPGQDYRNNVINISRSGTGIKRCIHFATTSSSIISNNNEFYMNAAAGTDNNLGQFGTTSYATLADWQTANGAIYDQLSISVDPTFTNPGSGDYTPGSSFIDNSGTPLGIATDINGTTRDLLTPDPGAYEFSTVTVGVNMGAEALVTPEESPTGCYTSSETVTIRIRNSSTATINFAVHPVTVTVNVSGAVTQMLTIVLNTGTLASDATMDVALPATLDMSASGTYTFNAFTTVAGDVNPANDAILPVDRVKQPLSLGTVIASPEVFCVTPGAPMLIASGETGVGTYQWQESTVSGSGFTDIAGATTPSYTVGSAITQTMYYKLVIGCGTATATSPEVSVMISNPQVVSTTPATVCGGGNVTLSAVGSPGADLKWYAAPTGGAPLGTGTDFTTSVSSTTDFYVEANTAGGGGASPILITEIDIGTNDQLEIQNVSGSSVDVTGWKVAISNSYTDINSVNGNIQTLSGVMNPGDTKSWTDQTSASNYWGSNILWNPGSFPGFAGWAAILDNNNNLVDIVFLNWPSANIQAASVTVGTTTITAGSQWSGDGINQATVAGTQSISRQGTLDNNDAGDFSIINLSVGSTNPGMTIPFSGFGCSSTRVPVTATVQPAPSATISYAGTPFCNATGTVNVTMTGTTGGVFSSTAGLVIDPVTGAIDMDASTNGTYTITYTVAATGACPQYQATTDVILASAPVATIAYAGSPYCSNGGTATVTQNGTPGGTYSSTTGLTINATSGDIDLAASAPGTYTVTYSIAASGACPPLQTTTLITITAMPSAMIAYSGAPFCNGPGTASVTLTGTTGGVFSSAAGLSINSTTGDIDLGTSSTGTYTVAYTVAAANGCDPFQATTIITLSANPTATINYAGSPYCSNGTVATITRIGSGGGTYSSTAGLSINSTTGEVDITASTAGTYTVTYFIPAGSGCSSFQATTDITITPAPAATIDYSNSPYCSNAGIATVTQTGTSGGVYTSTPALSIDAATGAVDLAASSPGTYPVTYTVAAANGCGQFQTTASITISAAPSATISYAGSPYCGNAGIATVTQSGTGGGSYSSTAGLIIDAVSGEIDLNASTPGTYTVTYSIAAANGCAQYDATTGIIITTPPSATISYAGSPYCANGGTATVTQSGTGGGTYSSTSGLSINAATGAINLGASAAGTYTVVYTIAPANGCLEYQATTSITITPQPSASISYVGSPFCISGTTAIVTQAGTPGGTYTSTAGLNINGADGTINLGGSTPGTYTVTYTVAAAGGCAQFQTTAMVTIVSGGTWMGTTSSDWNTASNWCGGIPSSAVSVTIPSSAPNMPNLSSGNGSVRNITIANGASLTIGNAGSLDLYGDITGAGTLDATNGSISFRGAAMQTVPGFTATNVTVNGAGLTPGGNMTVTGTLTLTNGNIIIGSNNLSLGNSSNGSVTSHIVTNGNGQVIVTNLAAAQNRTVPVGSDATSYNPVMLVANAGHVTDNIMVRVKEGVFENGISGITYTTHVADRMWILNEATPGGSNVNVSFQWISAQELPSFNRASCYVMQHDGTDWVRGAAGQASGTDPYVQTKTNVTSFSSFAVETQRIPRPSTGVYPNPTPDYLNVVTDLLSTGPVVFSVFDNKGRLVYKRQEVLNVGLNLTTLDVRNLAEGIYILKVSTRLDREFLIQKFIKGN